MSGWISQDIKKKTQGTIKKIEATRGKIDETEQDRIKTLFQKHYKKQLEIEDIFKRIPFMEDNVAIIYVKIPKEFKIKASENGNFNLQCACPLLERVISVFIPGKWNKEDKEWLFPEKIWDKELILRGRMKITYKLPNETREERKYGTLLETFLKENELESLDELDTGEYVRFFTFNFLQLIEVVQ